MLIKAYDENWILAFMQLKKILEKAIENLSVSIEHIGSTAVPQLAAKPIIDIDMIYSMDTSFETIKQRLEKIGYYHNGNQGIPGREVFKRNKMTSKHDILDSIQHHLYVCPEGSEELRRHLLFRNYLLANKDAREAYQHLKYSIAAQANQDQKLYAQLKELQAHIFVNDILEKSKILYEMPTNCRTHEHK
jgi:GrpB-like predicted nucleotidyltransferase (UPF0157 family)